MQTLNTSNRQHRGIGMVVLNNHFGTAAPFNVCGSLPTHALDVFANRVQPSQSHHANGARPLKNLGGQLGIGEPRGAAPTRSLHRKANSLDVS
jgi:hypothetical protein